MAGPPDPFEGIDPEHPPVEIQLCHWGLWPHPWRHSRANIAAMCQEGINAVRTNRCDALHFKVMKDEIEFIQSYMKEHAPDIDHNFKKLS